MINKEIEELFASLFSNVIGQDEAKRKLKFYMGGYAQTRQSPYFMLCGSKGQGKTMLAREMAKGFIKFDEKGRPIIDSNTKKPKRKTFVEINASSIKSVGAFVNGVVIPHVVDKDVVIFIDEAHELKHDVTNALLTILNPGSEFTQFVHEDYLCDFNHKRQTFFFATSESQKLFPPLMDRMTRIDLASYTPDEMARIVKKHSGDIEFEDLALEDIVTVLRANARAAAKAAQDIKIYLEKCKTFTNSHWQDLKHILGIKPLGLNATEISVLHYLKENPNGTSLTRLSAKTGFSKESLQRDYEIWLMKNNLMVIETSGRHITPKGLQYLKELN